jgi:hypothetical protein
LPEFPVAGMIAIRNSALEQFREIESDLKP